MRTDYDTAVQAALDLISKPEQLVAVVLSGRLPNTSPECARVDVRPVKIKDTLQLQVVRTLSRGVDTKNLPLEHAPSYIEELIGHGYSNLVVKTTDSLWQCRITKRRVALIHVESRTNAPRVSHDRDKPRLLDSSDPFLIAVGISDGQGQLKPSKRDKYLQIDEFVKLFAQSVEQLVADGHLPEPTEQHPLRVVDLGCGHAYLTFAVLVWAQRIRGWPVELVGIDRREDSMQRNAQLAAQLGVTGMTFQAAEIAGASAFDDLPISVVIALHACDTATDDALAWAAKRRAQLILAAPCCHHDLQKQLTSAPSPYQVLTRHGLIKERFADILTDALRMSLLRQQGYRVDAVEFIAGDHTPRNLMIRAVFTGAQPAPEIESEINELKSQWSYAPALETRLHHLRR